MTVFWPALIGGVVLMIGGAVIIAKRSNLASWTANAQRSTFGKSAERVASRQTPTRVMVTGVFMVGLGIVGIVLSLMDLQW